MDLLIEGGSNAATAACAPALFLAPACGFAVKKAGDLLFWGMEKTCEHLDKKQAGLS
ncbi:unnamed protein product [Meloidogyne enterolobii]|uniref:Uncharacterized protein n=1 Tax=Meloidogyne enterolobii TaxID=390850 RepID=A0ACB0YDX0_MELEN